VRHATFSLIDRILRLPLRLLLSGLHGLLKSFWFIRRLKTDGAHALPLTPEGAIVLVKLRYAPGWRLPGGGRKESEDAAKAVLRELEEEIGMTSHGMVIHACELQETPDFKRDTASLFIVRDVRYLARWSLEVEAVMEALPDMLPQDISARTARWIETLRPSLQIGKSPIDGTDST
jgi:ADP-ribose pyrophosphatase YjhB (NUDIX family)